MRELSDQPPSDDELSAGKVGLTHVETKTGTSTRRLVLSCVQCGTTQDFPICPECGEPMDLENGNFTHHGNEVPISEHHGQPMKPKIV